MFSLINYIATAHYCHVCDEVICCEVLEEWILISIMYHDNIAFGLAAGHN